MALRSAITYRANTAARRPEYRRAIRPRTGSVDFDALLNLTSRAPRKVKRSSSSRSDLPTFGSPFARSTGPCAIA